MCGLDRRMVQAPRHGAPEQRARDPPETVQARRGVSPSGQRADNKSMLFVGQQGILPFWDSSAVCVGGHLEYREAGVPLTQGRRDGALVRAQPLTRGRRG